MIKTLIKIAIAGVPTIIIGMLLIRLVDLQRGYSAIGGEWFAIVCIFAFFYFLVDRIM